MTHDELTKGCMGRRPSRCVLAVAVLMLGAACGKGGTQANDASPTPSPTPGTCEGRQDVPKAVPGGKMTSTFAVRFLREDVQVLKQAQAADVWQWWQCWE